MDIILKSINKMEILETIEYRGHNIEIYQDELCGSPREWDTLGIIATIELRSYTIGEETFKDASGFEDQLKRDKCIYLPVYMMDHSGISLSTSDYMDKWDSGQIGYIYVSPNRIRSEYGIARITKKIRDRVIEQLKGEIEVYSQYVSGDVYGLYIEDITSISGFYGYNYEKNGLLETARDEIDNYISAIQANKAKKLKDLISNNVPLEKRENILSKFNY